MVRTRGGLKLNFKHFIAITTILVTSQSSASQSYLSVPNFVKLAETGNGAPHAMAVGSFDGMSSMQELFGVKGRCYRTAMDRRKAMQEFIYFLNQDINRMYMREGVPIVVAFYNYLISAEADGSYAVSPANNEGLCL